MRLTKAGKRVLLEWLQIVAGLLIFSFGVHLTIYANIGLAPWDCLGMGVSYHTPLNYGISMTVIAVIILLVDLRMGERIGYETIIDAFLTGNFVQMYNDLNPLPENHNVWVGVAVMIVGFVFMSLGMCVCMKAAQCCGPRDALLVAIGKRLPRVPIGMVGALIWAVVLLFGWLLGGPVGIGTLLSVFGAGLVMQLLYNLIRFEPRDIKHRDVFEITKILAGKEQAEE